MDKPDNKTRYYQNTSKITEKDVREYVLERFAEVKIKPKMDEIIKFHSSNKYLLMAHNYENLKVLGNILANHKKENIIDLLPQYEKILKLTLNQNPTVKTHTNVLLHIFGFFKTYFNKSQKEEFLNHIDQYRKNKISLGKILCVIEPETYKINSTYLVSQTYFLLYAELSGINSPKGFLKFFAKK